MPLGPYPQLRLCGQVGMTPSKISIKTMIKIVPNDISSPYLTLIVIPLTLKNRLNKKDKLLIKCNTITFIINTMKINELHKHFAE